MDLQNIQLVTVDNSETPYIQATVLAQWLEYKDDDAVSQICRRREGDFNDREVYTDKKGSLWLDYNGALKVCMFSSQPRAKIARDEVIRVYREWRSGTLTSYEEMSPSARAYHLARSVMELAQEQMKQEKILKQHDEEIHDISHRVSQIEAKQNNGFISESQASKITVRVKEIGELLSTKEGKSMYGTVYTKMYEAFGVTSYKNLPTDMYDEVISWLDSAKERVLKKLGGKVL